MSVVNYSISEQAHSRLENYSEQYYDTDGAKSSVIVDAIRYGIDPTPAQRVLKQRLTEQYIPDRIPAHQYKRGETVSVSFRCPDDLLEQFRNEARRVYSQRKVGKYLSKLVYEYCLTLDAQAQEYLETNSETTKDWVDRLRGNYNADINSADLPESLTIPKTPKVAVPLLLIFLRNQSSTIYKNKHFRVIAENILSKHIDVSERTLEKYIEQAKDRMETTVNLYTGLEDISQDIAGYYETETVDYDLIEQDVNRWCEGWMDILDYRHLDKKERRRITDSCEACIDQYGEHFDMSAVVELKEAV